MEKLSKCKFCKATPIIELKNKELTLKCHGYSVVRPSLDRAVRIWNIEQKEATWNFSGPLKRLKAYKQGQRPLHRKHIGSSSLELEKSLSKIIRKP